VEVWVGLFDKLLGKRPDPTAAWRVFCLPIPEIDAGTLKFGGLRIGDPIEAAAELGRPESFCATRRSSHCVLTYAAGGFFLEFYEGRLEYLAFYIGPDPSMEPLAKELKVTFASPRVRCASGEIVTLSCQSDRAAVERIFGPPESLDVDEDETILSYERPDVTMEFELEGASGRLKRWQLFRRQRQAEA
jgi:hypothetical protein